MHRLISYTRLHYSSVLLHASLLQALFFLDLLVREWCTKYLSSPSSEGGEME